MWILQRELYGALAKVPRAICLTKALLFPIRNAELPITSNAKVQLSVTESVSRYVATFPRISSDQTKRVDKCLTPSELYETSKFNLGPGAPRKDQNKSKSITHSGEGRRGNNWIDVSHLLDSKLQKLFSGFLSFSERVIYWWRFRWPARSA